MSLTNGFFTLRDAIQNTMFRFTKQVFASSWDTNQLAMLCSMTPVLDFSTDGTQSSVEYRRRAKGQYEQLKYIAPGSGITTTADPHIMSLRSYLRFASQNVKIPSTLRTNFNNAPFGIVNGRPDPLLARVMMLIDDWSRRMWETAFTGRHIDSAVMTANTSLPANFINGSISPGPYNDKDRGTGYLKWDAGNQEVSYKAPGDSDFGVPEAVITGQTVTLTSAHIQADVTFTLGTLPGSNGTAEIVFSSSTNQPDGLIQLIEPSMKVTLANATNFEFKMVGDLLNKLAPVFQESPRTVIVMHPDNFEAAYNLSQQSGGALIKEEAFDKVFAEYIPPGTEKFTLRTIHTYRGHPILKCSQIPVKMIGGKPTRAMFAVSLDPTAGMGDGMDVGGFAGIVAGSMADDVRATFAGGWSVKYIGTSENADVDVARVNLSHGWVLGHGGAAAMVEGLYDPSSIS